MNKICMLSTGHGPMDDRIFYKEVLSLSKRYGQIVLVMPGRQEDFRHDEPGIQYVPLRKAYSLLSRFLLLPAALINVLRINPAVCHFHDFELIFILPFLRAFSKCKIIYDVHEVHPEMVLESKKIPPLLRRGLAGVVDVMEKFLCRFADRIVTSDESIKERFTGVHPGTITIFNYPRLSIFVPGEARLSLLRERYRGRIPVLYQGSVSETRGLFQMIRAMRILRERRPEILLLIVGGMEDTLLARAVNEIRALKVEGCVEIVGWVPHEEVVDYIFVSRIGLVPLQPTEKFMKNIPIKQFEYMACGVPVLGANLPPIASYVKSAGCGRVFDSTRPEALAEGVMAILDDEKEWLRMSEAGKKAVSELWNWDEMEKRLLSVYGELLQG